MNFTYQKLGFVRAGVLRAALQVASGHYVDCYRWGLLADDWRARQAALGRARRGSTR